MDDNSLSCGLTGLKHATWVPVIRDGNNLGWRDPLPTPTVTTGNAGERP